MKPPSDASPRGGPSAAAIPRILVVEDGLIMARDIERRLTTMGYQVAGVATTGNDAVTKARECSPDLILMDVHLRGEVDGIQAAAQIRAHADIPIVYVTAYSDEATLRRARLTEPFGYVLKPFEERELRTIIEIALSRHAMDSQLRESEKRYRAIAATTPAYAYSVAVHPDGSLSTEWVTDEFTHTGLAADALANLSQHVHPDDNTTLKNRMRRLLSGEHDVAEYRIVTKEGEHRWWVDHARPYWDEAKRRIIRIMGTAHDITERKHAQEHTAALLSAQADAETEARSTLQTCIRDLSDILGALTQTKSRDGEPDSSVLSARLMRVLKIYAMAYDAGKPSDAGDVIRSTTAEVFKRLGCSRLTYTVEAEPLRLDAGTTWKVALIVQELLQNAVRHAYKEGACGEITVTLCQTAIGKGCLRVVDSGSGLRKDIDLRRPKTSGFRLVNHLVRQLNGSLDCERGSGTAIAVTFPLRSS
jgi:PAS domain S-box-containing protein